MAAKQGDRRALASAKKTLAGKGKTGGLRRLLPFLGPAFIARLVRRSARGPWFLCSWQPTHAARSPGMSVAQERIVWIIRFLSSKAWK